MVRVRNNCIVLLQSAFLWWYSGGYSYRCISSNTMFSSCFLVSEMAGILSMRRKHKTNQVCESWGFPWITYCFCYVKKSIYKNFMAASFAHISLKFACFRFISCLLADGTLHLLMTFHTILGCCIMLWISSICLKFVYCKLWH